MEEQAEWWIKVYRDLKEKLYVNNALIISMHVEYRVNKLHVQHNLVACTNDSLLSDIIN